MTALTSQKRGMIIGGRGTIKRFFTCPVCTIIYVEDSQTPVTNEVPMFDTEQEAYEAGWRKTDDLMFCDDTRPFVWVCPNCWPGDHLLIGNKL